MCTYLLQHKRFNFKFYSNTFKYHVQYFSREYAEFIAADLIYDQCCKINPDITNTINRKLLRSHKSTMARVSHIGAF